MLHRILAITAALAVLPALLAAASSTASSPGGVTVATGTVVNAQRQALAGVAVDLYAWPSAAVLQALTPGQAVPTKLLASTTTSATGSYTLTVPQAALDAAAIEQGWANLEVDSVGGASWSFPYQTDPAAAEHVNLTVNVTPPGICTTPSSTPWFFLRQLAKAWGVVGQGYVVKARTTRGDWVNFVYSQGQSSTLGLGVSAKGFAVGYSVGGTEKEWTTGTQTMPRQYQRNALFRTEFRVALYRQLCLNADGKHRHQKGHCPKKYMGGTVEYCLWKVRSNGWAGGDSILYPKRPPYTPRYDCVQELAHSSFYRDHGVAVTWSKGLEIDAADGIGFNGQSQTGYDTAGHMKFYFNAYGHLCGTNGDPPTAAQMVARRHGS
jgi:hypothetical protein